MTPVILVVFANDQATSLDLVDERDKLRQVFNDSGRLQIKILENASFDLINETIIDEKLHDRIVAFHYAGHANGKNIKLVHGEANVQALARLLNSLPNLQLIFLNGCDTSEQTREIRKAGVVAPVVTTLKPVSDDIAIDFAYYFYFAYYRFLSLNDSFESAETRIIGKYGLNGHVFIKKDRGLSVQEESEIDTDLQGGNGVYTLTASGDDMLNKSLVLETVVVVEEETPSQDDAAVNYQPNRTLIQQMTDGIINGDSIPEAFKQTDEFIILSAYYNAYQRNPDNRNLSLLVNNLLNVLPYPIGFHVQELTQIASKENLTRDEKKNLLKRQVITYDSLIQLLTFTLLSTFWIELEKKNDLKITDAQWKVLKTFMWSDATNNKNINYAAVLSTVRAILEANELDPFISEYRDLNQIFRTEEQFYETHFYMQGMKNKVNSNEIDKMDIWLHCAETEDLLAKIFSKVGFIVRYKLTTVKNIEFAKSRLKGPFYYIKRKVLHFAGSSQERDDIAEFDEYTDTRSVILAKGLDRTTFTKFISLSPFIIDESAQKGEAASQLYFFSHTEDDGYVYRWARNPETTLKINNRTYTKGVKTTEELDALNLRMQNIQQEMEAFKNLINR